MIQNVSTVLMHAVHLMKLGSSRVKRTLNGETYNYVDVKHAVLTSVGSLTDWEVARLDRKRLQLARDTWMVLERVTGGLLEWNLRSSQDEIETKLTEVAKGMMQ